MLSGKIRAGLNRLSGNRGLAKGAIAGGRTIAPNESGNTHTRAWEMRLGSVWFHAPGTILSCLSTHFEAQLQKIFATIYATAT